MARGWKNVFAIQRRQTFNYCRRHRRRRPRRRFSRPKTKEAYKSCGTLQLDSHSRMNGPSNINQLVFEIRRHLFNLIFFPIEGCPTPAPKKRLMKPAAKKRRRQSIPMTETQVELNDALSNLYKDVVYNHWKIKIFVLISAFSLFLFSFFSPTFSVFFSNLLP